MKRVIIVLVVAMLFILSIPTWFLYTRFRLPRYIYDGTTLVYKNNVYVPGDYDINSDRSRLGKPIGLAMYKDEKINFNNFFFNDTVFEYKDDKEHNRIFVKVFMDGSGDYKRVKK